MLIGHFWMQAFDLAQQPQLLASPWTVRGKPLPLPAVFPEGILANIGRTKQAENAAETLKDVLGETGYQKTGGSGSGCAKAQMLIAKTPRFVSGHGLQPCRKEAKKIRL